MELADLLKIQQKFQEDCGFGQELSDERLSYLTIALTGEAGEFANAVKKYLRERRYGAQLEKDRGKDWRREMEEELTDVFIYVLTLALLLDLDLEQSFLAKERLNRERFAVFKEKR